jgi:hypothetical protein
LIEGLRDNPFDARSLGRRFAPVLALDEYRLSDQFPRPVTPVFDRENKIRPSRRSETILRINPAFYLEAVFSKVIDASLRVLIFAEHTSVTRRAWRFEMSTDKRLCHRPCLKAIGVTVSNAVFDVEYDKYP